VTVAAQQARTRRVHRSRTTGRAASVSTYLGVGVVAALLAGIVALQIGALRANMEAGALDATRRTVLVDVVNARAELARQFPRARVDEAARTLGMLIPRPGAYHQISARPKP
jgi:hypothetical protein